MWMWERRGWCTFTMMCSMVMRNQSHVSVVPRSEWMPKPNQIEINAPSFWLLVFASSPLQWRISHPSTRDPTRPSSLNWMPLLEFWIQINSNFAPNSNEFEFNSKWMYEFLHGSECSRWIQIQEIWFEFEKRPPTYIGIQYTWFEFEKPPLTYVGIQYSRFEFGKASSTYSGISIEMNLNFLPPLSKSFEFLGRSPAFYVATPPSSVRFSEVSYIPTTDVEIRQPQYLTSHPSSHQYYQYLWVLPHLL